MPLQFEKAQEAIEYRVYEHPILPQRIVKHGFSWPGLIVGPAWLLFKKLWMAFAVWSVLLVVVVALAYPSELIILAFQLTTIVALGFSANEMWEQDLERRGYTLARRVQARSVDEVRAILARETG